MRRPSRRCSRPASRDRAVQPSTVEPFPRARHRAEEGRPGRRRDAPASRRRWTSDTRAGPTIGSACREFATAYDSLAGPGRPSARGRWRRAASTAIEKSKRKPLPAKPQAITVWKQAALRSRRPSASRAPRGAARSSRRLSRSHAPWWSSFSPSVPRIDCRRPAPRASREPRLRSLDARFGQSSPPRT